MIFKIVGHDASYTHLSIFRFAFGLILFYSMVRFFVYDWIDLLYIEPQFHFSYPGFSWVKPFGSATYLLFVLCGFLALFVAMGRFYLIAAIGLFLSFSYIELMDVTTYLNHYYLTSILALVMIFLPKYRFDKAYLEDHTRYFVTVLRMIFLIVYFYAGLAKLNSDWLVDAMPLKMWLPAKSTIPFIGPLLDEEWTAYLFSYAGAIYDLTIPFLLLWKRTRYFAIAAVWLFHVLTWILFPIGIFPFLMIAGSFLFIETKHLERIKEWISLRFTILKKIVIYNPDITLPAFVKLRKTVLGLILFIHLVFPWRYLFYPGEVFWTEEGFRFSWRVMLMEKAGYASFTVVDPENKQREVVQNQNFLTPLQEKQMATQPDLILQYAHFLESTYANKGWADPAVYVESYVALNGRQSKPFIDPEVDLTQVKNSFAPKTWILPFGDNIWGI